jgi:hypothetical protein
VVRRQSATRSAAVRRQSAVAIASVRQRLQQRLQRRHQQSAAAIASSSSLLHNKIGRMRIFSFLPIFLLMGIKKGGFSPLQPKTTNLNEP